MQGNFPRAWSKVYRAKHQRDGLAFGYYKLHIVQRLMQFIRREPPAIQHCSIPTLWCGAGLPESPGLTPSVPGALGTLGHQASAWASPRP